MDIWNITIVNTRFAHWENRFAGLMRNLIIIGLLWAIALPACAGDGVGLNTYGEPADTSDVVDPIVLGPTLASIQTNIFSAVCAVKCHRPPTPKKDLNLTDGKAYEYLVNVPSVEIPTMMRVAPGNADNSYLVWKLEGRDGIRNKKMPLNDDPRPLSTEEIEAIKTWIDEGAAP